MLDKVISGGQTGADQGGLRAARTAGIPTGGRRGSSGPSSRGFHLRMA